MTLLGHDSSVWSQYASVLPVPSVLHFVAVSVPASNTLASDHFFCELESREIVVMGYESVSLRA